MAPLPVDPATLAAQFRLVIKDEPAATVELLGVGAEAVVVKTYRNRGLRLVQTWLRRSRAQREFANLAAVAALGLPCTPPRQWSERRHLGLVLRSTLVTDHVAGTRSLKALLADIGRGGRSPVRAALATALGRLLAALHQGGVLWATPMPRNVLVPTAELATGSFRLVLCDLPAAVHWNGPVPAAARLLDLFDAIASPSRQREWTRPERLRCLRAYCGGDPDRARRLWQTLARRRPFGQRLRKNLLMAVRTYILRRPAAGVRGAISQ